ncbi:hypothetical protein V6N12_012694 [Hibiscus sabdariffa]|uniref:Uncharacterized protein n=1 Tax=Hibiscus sabdariffa TaxID=183260 RepID=A0ABR2DDC5_9ROSI
MSNGAIAERQYTQCATPAQQPAENLRAHWSSRRGGFQQYQGSTMPTWNRMEHYFQESRDHQPPASPARGQTLEHVCKAQYHAHFPQPDSGPNPVGANQCHHLWLPLQRR